MVKRLSALALAYVTVCGAWSGAALSAPVKFIQPKLAEMGGPTNFILAKAPTKVGMMKITEFPACITISDATTEPKRGKHSAYKFMRNTSINGQVERDFIVLRTILPQRQTALSTSQRVPHSKCIWRFGRSSEFADNSDDYSRNPAVIFNAEIHRWNNGIEGLATMHVVRLIKASDGLSLVQSGENVGPLKRKQCGLSNVRLALRSGSASFGLSERPISGSLAVASLSPSLEIIIPKKLKAIWNQAQREALSAASVERHWAHR
jgi:hypothetical protein